ncbi:hypothetical protein KUV50_09580 [Membranicola marinus]|uniref:PIN domain-containing protein n=1 Tax=Membranihabitans marinus TaxID=1227546 RepID=A0A953HXD7_9BACT|nr:hypothetical protein [Membranihabitans marinus]MBY5958381.1 hypothetical protein [Membranihabitans marinus]
MRVISDTTIISNLVQIDELEILERLYSEVIIPVSVYDELQILVDRGIVSRGELEVDWIIVKSVVSHDMVSDLLNRLDLGESESIILGMELNADYLLIDEKSGRMEGVKRGMKIIGTLGILIKAKQSGFINSVEMKI